jgi:multidrug efflux system outer membrane protein
MRLNELLTQPRTFLASAGPAGVQTRISLLWRQSAFVTLGVLAAFLSGCAVSSDYHRPEVALPEEWNAEMEQAAEAANVEWWKQFDDPVLDELIATALTENRDLSIAAARIAEYTGRLQTSRSALFPEVSYGGSVTRDQRSQEGATPIRRDEERTNTSFEAAVGVNWELDLWKRIGKANEASRAELLSVVEERQALVLSLVSAVAVSYLDLLSLDRQLEITRETVAYRGEWLEIFEKKGEGGQISGLELAQVRSAYEQAAALVPRLELQISLAEHELSALLGRNPGSVQRGRAIETLGMPEVPQGIPADVLIRRPDVRQREQSLIAANARIGEVRARYFPQFSLTGVFGFASTQISNWLTDSASLWSGGLGVLGPLFKGGRIKGEVKQAEARQQQMIYEYLKAIQTGLREVEDALISVRKLRELLAIEERQVAALEEYAVVAQNRYDAGYSNSYLEILDADRSLYVARVEQAQTRRDLFAALVRGYKAMGGGWDTVSSGAQR